MLDGGGGVGWSGSAGFIRCLLFVHLCGAGRRCNAPLCRDEQGYAAIVLMRPLVTLPTSIDRPMARSYAADQLPPSAGCWTGSSKENDTGGVHGSRSDGRARYCRAYARRNDLARRCLSSRGIQVRIRFCSFAFRTTRRSPKMSSTPIQAGMRATAISSSARTRADDTNRTASSIRSSTKPRMATTPFSGAARWRARPARSGCSVHRMAAPPSFWRRSRALRRWAPSFPRSPHRNTTKVGPTTRARLRLDSRSPGR